jgi:hypothetical protein
VVVDTPHEEGTAVSLFTTTVPPDGRAAASLVSIPWGFIGLGTQSLWVVDEVDRDSKPFSIFTPLLLITAWRQPIDPNPIPSGEHYMPPLLFSDTRCAESVFSLLVLIVCLDSQREEPMPLG